MADITAATIHAQLKPEVTPGSILAADKQMLSFGFPRWKPMGEGQVLTPQGYKVPTTMVPVGRRWVEGTYEGVIDYNEVEYVLNSVLNKVSPSTDGTNGKRWTHSISPSTTESREYFSMEQGNNQHAQKASYMFFNSLRLEMTALIQKMSGNFMAQMFTDDITITPGPTILTPQVVNPASFDVRIASTYATLVGTAQVETATAATTTSGAGNVTVTVTAAGMTGSPKAVVVALASGDTASVWAGKVRTALAADTDINAYFNIGGSTTAIVLTRRAAAADDATLNIAIADTGTTGITPVVTSANTTPGVAPASVYSRPFGVTLDIPNVMDILFRMNSADSSYISTSDIPITPVATIRTDADDAGMAYLANWAAGSQLFFSVTANGTSGGISGAQVSTYGLQLIAACRIGKGYSPVEDRGNAQAEWPFELMYDPTSSSILTVVTTGTLAAL